MSDINVTLRGETVGSVTFDQPDKALGGSRTASGFRLHLPATIIFHPPQDESALLLENLQATLSASGVEIGVARYPEAFRSVAGKRSFSFAWDWTISALAVYEQLRAGREAEFSITLSGDIRYLLPGQGWKESLLNRINVSRTGRRSIFESGLDFYFATSQSARCCSG